MKQVIPFVKDLMLENKIYEITSIALEHNLKMENSDSIVGVFTVNGKYRVNEISVNEEEFSKDINFDITLDDKYDSKKVTIDIDDFYYEIVNDDILRVHIDVLLNNLIIEKNIIPKIEKEDEPEIISIDDIKIPSKPIEPLNRCDKVDDKQIDLASNNFEQTKQISKGFLDNTEGYATYKIHIVRENDSVDTIISKYEVTKDDLLEYNDLENLMLGSKVVIPIKNE